MSDRKLYYIVDFTDEWMVCAPTLEGWAGWLAKPGAEAEEDWAGRGDIVDGAEFTASTMARLADIDVTRTSDGWLRSREPESDAGFFARAYYGGGWDAETACDEFEEFLRLLVENEVVETGETLSVAVCRNLPDVVIRFNRAPAGPTCTVISTVT